MKSNNHPLDLTMYRLMMNLTKAICTEVGMEDWQSFKTMGRKEVEKLYACRYNFFKTSS